MNNFYPIITDDGTISLFNTEINDIYHSKIGAYTESFNKFFIPSGIKEHVKLHNEVAILDVCFGLGYNSKVAISEIWKINPSCKITLTAIELDPYVLAYSKLAVYDGIAPYCYFAFNSLIDSLVQNNSIFHNDVSFLEAINQELLKNEYKILPESQNRDNLHNIYYQPIATRNNNGGKIEYKSNLLDITLFICDLRDIIMCLDQQYDFIFHDAFTPSKVPELWSVELFFEYHRILNLGGNTTTYSSSAAIRAGLIESGFYVGRTEPIGRKSSGTIAYNNPALLMNPLSETEKGLLNTTAGVPYRDSELSLTSDKITANRIIEQKFSGRITSSKFNKLNKS